MSVCPTCCQHERGRVLGSPGLDHFHASNTAATSSKLRSLAMCNGALNHCFSGIFDQPRPESLTQPILRRFHARTRDATACAPTSPVHWRAPMVQRLAGTRAQDLHCRANSCAALCVTALPRKRTASMAESSPCPVQASRWPAAWCLTSSQLQEVGVVASRELGRLTGTPRRG